MRLRCTDGNPRWTRAERGRPSDHLGLLVQDCGESSQGSGEGMGTAGLGRGQNPGREQEAVTPGGVYAPWGSGGQWGQLEGLRGRASRREAAGKVRSLDGPSPAAKDCPSPGSGVTDHVSSCLWGQQAGWGPWRGASLLSLWPDLSGWTLLVYRH